MAMTPEQRARKNARAREMRANKKAVQDVMNDVMRVNFPHQFRAEQERQARIRELMRLHKAICAVESGQFANVEEYFAAQSARRAQRRREYRERVLELMPHERVPQEPTPLDDFEF